MILIQTSLKTRPEDVALLCSLSTYLPELCCGNTIACVAVNQFYSFILEVFHFSRKIFCICHPSGSLLSPWLTLLLYCHSQRPPDSLDSLLVVCLWILKSEKGKQKAEARARELVAFLENGIGVEKRSPMSQ